MDPLTLPQINLVFQIAILAILTASLAFKQKHKYLIHGATMLIAATLNIISFLLVMLPSLLSLEIVATQPTTWFSLITLTHASLGAISLALAIWLLASWHLQGNAQNCAKRKITMLITIVLWSVVLLLGIAVYWYLYVF